MKLPELTPRARGRLRAAKTEASSAYGLGGRAKSGSHKPKKVTLTRAEYEADKASEREQKK